MDGVDTGSSGVWCTYDNQLEVKRQEGKSWVQQHSKDRFNFGIRVEARFGGLAYKRVNHKSFEVKNGDYLVKGADYRGYQFGLWDDMRGIFRIEMSFLCAEN